MTAPKAGAAQQRLQRYLEQKKRLEAKIRRERTKQQVRTRRLRARRWHQFGELVALAELDPIDPEILLGMLLEGAARIQDPATWQQWKAAGNPVLEARGISRWRAAYHSKDEATPANPTFSQGFSLVPSPRGNETVNNNGGDA
jgi:Conjugal transfer protein TraD